MGHRGLASVCLGEGRGGAEAHDQVRSVAVSFSFFFSSQQAPSEVEVMPEEDVVVAVTLSFLLGRRARAGIAA